MKFNYYLQELTYDLDILLEFLQQVMYPFLNQYHHQVNVSIENLEDNHMIQPLYVRHPKQNQLIRHLLYNGLWPNCYPHQIALKLLENFFF